MRFPSHLIPNFPAKSLFLFFSHFKWLDTSAKDGAYYGISLGLEYYNFLAEVGYYHTSSRISFASSPQKTVAYKQVSYNNDAIRLSIGYKF